MRDKQTNKQANKQTKNTCLELLPGSWARRQSSSWYGRWPCKRCSSLRGGSRTCCTRSRPGTFRFPRTTCVRENGPEN